jgi:hypothetical protein
MVIVDYPKRRLLLLRIQVSLPPDSDTNDNINASKSTEEPPICPDGTCEMTASQHKVHLDRRKGPLYDKSCIKCGNKITTKTMRLLSVYYCKHVRHDDDCDDDSACPRCYNVICGYCYTPAVVSGKRIRTQREFEFMNGN